MDAVDLARIQFAFTAAFHFIFPAVSIGLGLLVAIAEIVRWRTKSEIWDRLARFWTKVFALTFAVGVATGIVMEFQFGTNWSHYSTFVGDIFGSPLAAEAVFAFFLESTFLGLLLWGRNRVGSGLRMVSAPCWCRSVPSCPASGSSSPTRGCRRQPATRSRATSGPDRLLAAVFNPSTLTALLRTPIISAWAVAAFIMVGVGAWYLLKHRHYDIARRSIRLGLVVAIIASVGMFLTGDSHARQVANTQPVKFAAMNGLFETSSGVPMIIFAFPPSQEGASDLPSLAIPDLLSLLTRFDSNATIEGLEDYPHDQWPPVGAVFSTYHLMVGLGTLMLLAMLLGALAWIARTARDLAIWLWIAVIVTPAPLIAVELGWATAEIGRQPWIVYGLMKTADGVSPLVTTPEVLVSLLGFVGVYIALFALWVFLVRRVLMAGPAAGARRHARRVAT